MRAPESLVAYAHNARTHSAAQIEQIMASIEEFGFTNPVLVDADSGIIAGHGRVLAALRMGLAQVPSIELAHLTEAQRRAYVIADNKFALNAGWDEELLGLELVALEADGFDVALTGFDGDELAGLMGASEGLTDEDEAPDEPTVAISAPSDLWILGEHRLFCGDATAAGDVERVLDDHKPHLMVTDPPYGVEYDPAWRDDAAKYSPSMGNRKDTAKGAVANDDRADWREAWALFSGDVAYVWCASLRSHDAAASLLWAGFILRAQLIWSKNYITVGRGHYQWQHEPCWYAVRKGRTGHWFGGRKQTTVWNIDKPQKSETGHGTQKPVECMRRPIVNHTRKGDAVYDPFVGSGTTIIAAETIGRVCYAIDVDPIYVDVAVRRWQDFTGKKATLDGSRRTFDKIGAERIPDGKAQHLSRREDRTAAA